MIVSQVSDKQLKIWRELFEKSKLDSNRISGKELNSYFQNKYQPKEIQKQDFWNLMEECVRELEQESLDIKLYQVGSVLVGIELNSGYFHVESEDISQSIPIWDDLFVTRGLDAEDLENYVLVGEYIELIQK